MEELDALLEARGLKAALESRLVHVASACARWPGFASSFKTYPAVDKVVKLVHGERVLLVAVVGRVRVVKNLEVARRLNHVAAVLDEVVKHVGVHLYPLWLE